MKPLARSGLIARRAGDELVVYDPQTHLAHCLNATAAGVFLLADGNSNVAAIAERLGRDIGLEVDADVVSSALDRLAAARLLERDPPSRPKSPSRRRVMRQVALGTTALAPVVLSLVVPSPAEAANTCIPASSCNASNFGQPCFNLSTAECASKTCTGAVGDCQ